MNAIERIIQQAMADGQFDNLPGQGEPLSLEHFPFEDPANAAAHHMLKQQGFSLPWIALGKEIDATLIEATRRLAQRHAWIAQRGVALAESGAWHRAEREFREQITAINREIERFNLNAPLSRLHRRLVDADRIIAQVVRARIDPDP